MRKTALNENILSRLEPYRIKYFPDTALDVVFETLVDTPAEALVDTPAETLFVDTPVDTSAAPLSLTLNKNPTHTPSPNDNLNPPPLSETLLPSSSGMALSPQDTDLTKGDATHAPDTLATAIELANQSGKPLTPGQVTSLLNTRLTQALTAKSGFEKVVIHGLGAIHDQAVQTQQIAREVFELQKQMHDRLIMIHNKTEAILTQNFELTEYPIPRLFIVLPETSTAYDPDNWIDTKFRLHFICECGEHTKTVGSKLPHHLHLAKHEGYLVREPTEFFKKYGPYLLLMLEMIKFGTTIAGHAVPPLASLRVVELVDPGQQSVETVTAMIDYSRQCIEKQMEEVQEPASGSLSEIDQPTTTAPQDLNNYLSNIETLEGADLRQLESYLKTSDGDNLLGNLYRMITRDGHVKWVCHDHYRAGYQEAHTQKLRDVVKIAGGTFDEQLGKVEIALQSSLSAQQFYDALRRVKGVVELTLDMSWDCAKKDMDALHAALEKSMVSNLRVDLHRFRSSLASKLSSPSLKYAGLYRLLEPHNLKIVHIVLPSEFVKVSNFTPRIPPHLHKLSFEIAIGSSEDKEIRVLGEALGNHPPRITLHLRDKAGGEKADQAHQRVLETNTTLTSLNLHRSSIRDKGLQALSEAFKTDSSLISLNLQSNHIGDKGVVALSEILKTNSTLTSLDLQYNTIASKGALALAEALRVNCTLTDLNLQANSIGEKGAQALAEALKFNSTLTSLNLIANPIGVFGAYALDEAFRANPTLTSLRTDATLTLERRALLPGEPRKTNSTITNMIIKANPIGAIGGHGLPARSKSIGWGGDQTQSDAAKDAKATKTNKANAITRTS